MSIFPFKINTIPFYASEEPRWNPYGNLPSTTNDGRPNTAGPGAFSATLRAVSTNAAFQVGAGDPYESSGTFMDIVTAWRDSFADDYVQTYEIDDPRLDAYLEVTGILQIDQLLPAYQGGAAVPDVPIVVDYAFMDGATRAAYYGGEPYPSTAIPPFIPGDDLPAPTPGLTYGWGIGRWGYGYWGRGEGA